MKVIVDANVWISFLLARGKNNSITQAVQLTMSQAVQLIMPEEVIAEITRSIANSDYLMSRIPDIELSNLITQIAEIATIPPLLQGTQTRIVRDPGDDYLIAYGLIYDCDYLITGDADLLVLKHLRNMQIVTPVQFSNRTSSQINSQI